MSEPKTEAGRQYREFLRKKTEENRRTVKLARERRQAKAALKKQIEQLKVEIVAAAIALVQGHIQEGGIRLINKTRALCDLKGIDYVNR